MWPGPAEPMRTTTQNRDHRGTALQCRLLQVDRRGGRRPNTSLPQAQHTPRPLGRGGRRTERYGWPVDAPRLAEPQAARWWCSAGSSTGVPHFPQPLICRVPRCRFWSTMIYGVWGATAKTSSTSSLKHDLEDVVVIQPTAVRHPRSSTRLVCSSGLPNLAPQNAPSAASAVLSRSRRGFSSSTQLGVCRGRTSRRPASTAAPPARST